ncbi:unnamed protein product [Caenorhabditis sp. 36 PRJEB53466]|nr:unnamed protein product [Caenorhabditis sp. 36 PRJEB53466]
MVRQHSIVLLITFYGYFVQGLSKISIGLKPYQYQYVEPNHNQPVESVAEAEIPAFRTYIIPSGPTDLEESGQALKLSSIDNTAFITAEDMKPITARKRKTKQKPRRKPKKMHLRRVFKTRLITTTPRPIMIEENRIDEEATTKMINLAPIYDAESGISYTQSELNKICSETVNLGQMSFYWQQGLPNQQDTGQSTQQQQQGQWDFINLGGAPAPQHQWNSTVQQQVQPQQQQPQQQQHNYYYQQQPVQQQQFPQQQGQQHNGSAPYYQLQETQQQQWIQQEMAYKEQLRKDELAKAKQTVVEHTPLLPQPQSQQLQQNQASQGVQQQFTPTPPVLAPNYQNQQQQQNQYYQQQQYQEPKEVTPPLQRQPELQRQQQYRQHYEVKEVSPPVSTATPAASTYFPPPPIPQMGSLPTSKEVTPEPAYVAPAATHHVPVPTPPVFAPAPTAASTTPIAPKKENPLTVASSQAVVPAPVPEQKTKVTPTSSEDDWEKADMEVQRVVDENKRQKASAPAEKPEESRESSSLGGSWSQQDTEPSERSSAEPVEIVEMPTSKDNEEKTPRVSMSENTEPTPTPAHVSEERQKTPDVRHDLQTSSSILNSSSPGEAIATSTPKDLKIDKRSSISSQGTIDGGKKKKAKPEVRQEVPEAEEHSGNNSDSTMASGRPEFERGHVRASYREYQKAYKEICERLKIMRTTSQNSDFRPSSKLANPILAAAGALARHPAIRRESTGARNDGRASVPLPLPHSQSFNDASYQNGGGRRSRVSRLDPHRPASRQEAGYQQDPRILYAQQQQHQNYRQGRYSSMGIAYHGYPQNGYDSRRPQSAYMMEQYHEAYAQEPEETSTLSESEEDYENGESEDELRQYNAQSQNHQRHYGQVQYHQGGHDNGQTNYYCGVVHVKIALWNRVIEKNPVPNEFFKLRPIEKAAYMFYTTVYKAPYKDVSAFHNRFNREFYKYTTNKISEDEALLMVCQSMQQQYQKSQKKRQQEYESQKAHLFGDDTSIDGQSEINSVYEESLLSVDTLDRGPLKFTHPHSFLNISTGGRIIYIQPDQSISAIVFDDIKSELRDIATQQVTDAAMSFKGPLMPHQTQPHTVRLYISKQIENIKRSPVAQENPLDNDVVESLLVWQLLETMVKQQGNITGPDIAELLAKVSSQPVSIEAPPQPSNITPALNQFTQFLLGGHKEEAVESAIRNGLFADALILTRRLFPNDERRIEAIESRFLQTRSLNNPVTTLVSVAKGETPPVLTNPPLDDHLSWRTHAAIILANLDQSGTAMNTIYQLGRALAKRDYHCAADFCFLVYCVLGGNNPFEPVQAPEGEEDYRRHISLINSDVPDNVANPRCQYGFLITDLHATEIFDYALSLKPDRHSPLGRSVEFQTTRIKYAKLLANHGYNSDAFRYCMEVARAIWTHLELFESNFLLELCDLAESIMYAASVHPGETEWISSLRTIVLGRNAPHHEQYQEPPQTPQVEHNSLEQLTQNYGYQPDPIVEVPTEPLQPTLAPEMTNERVPTSTPIPVPAAQPVVRPSPAPTPILSHPPALEQHQQYNHEEYAQIPPTPSNESVRQEQHLAYSSQPAQYDEEGFAPLPDHPYSDEPLTMASSPPILAPIAEVAPPQTTLPPIVPQQTSQQIHQQPPVQPALPQMPPQIPQGQNPRAGGGLRGVRGGSRYAQAGSLSGGQAPAGMMPPAPPTATFGFMPAPADDDSEYVDPFSGQANPTIQQSGPIPSDE